MQKIPHGPVYSARGRYWIGSVLGYIPGTQKYWEEHGVWEDPVATVQHTNTDMSVCTGPWQATHISRPGVLHRKITTPEVRPAGIRGVRLTWIASLDSIPRSALSLLHSPSGDDRRARKMKGTSMQEHVEFVPEIVWDLGYVLCLPVALRR
jgi:hypothetical protein